jgi:hypothetical protein
LKAVGDARENVVDNPSEIASERADDRSDRDRDQGCDDAEEQCDSGTVKKLREYASAQLVGPERRSGSPGATMSANSAIANTTAKSRRPRTAARFRAKRFQIPVARGA